MNASPELLALLARKPAPDPEIVAGYMSGEITTRAATRYRDNRAGRRLQGRFTRPRYQRSPDREKSIRRRRQLAASGCMPPALAAQLTTSEQACARIIVDEIVTHGCFDRSLQELAARAGCCHKTAQRAVRRLSGGNHKITGLGWIKVEERPVDGRKHLTHIITIISPEWLMWIERGPIRPRSIGGHSCPTTVNVIHKSMSTRSTEPWERPERGLARVGIARSGPPDT